jgi:hypothetical protein
MPMTAGCIDRFFQFHQLGPGQRIACDGVREAGHQLAMTIFEKVPESPDRDDAIRKVREAVMLANQAVALFG